MVLFLLFATAINDQFFWQSVVAIINNVLSLAVYLLIVFPMCRRGERSTRDLAGYGGDNRSSRHIRHRVGCPVLSCYGNVVMASLTQLLLAFIATFFYTPRRY